MATNSIGPFTFAVIQGVPGILTASVEVIERANVDGTALRRLGRRGQAFSVRTIEDCESLDECRQLLAAYEGLVGDSPTTLVINDVDYFATDGVLVSVLAVAPVKMSKATSIVGGVNANSGAMLYAAWQLKVIAI